MSATLTTEEAKHLINMLKKSVEEATIAFPNKKETVQFEVFGEKIGDEFIVNIDRKGINYNKCTYQGRLKTDNIVLLRLDVNPSSKHVNPSNGETIEGTHLHIYNEDYDTKEAIPFNPKSEDLFEICFEFFKKFNIIKSPIQKHRQEDLFDKESL